MYAEESGSSPGIFSSPLAPTVYSVARTSRSPSGLVWPFGSSIVASVPGSNMSVAWRASASSWGVVLLVATWSVFAFSSIGVTFVSYAVITTSAMST